jgi:cyclopropane fatty-acyl-phospholipid synthase-like methyltransferase
MNEIVRLSYDAIAGEYAAQRDRFKSDTYLSDLTARLAPGAHVLDIGCGAGVPVDTYLLDRGFAVSGIDFSAKQIELARSNQPGAIYAVRDMLDLRAGDYKLDAVVSFYAIFHTPRQCHAHLLEVIRSFLAPEGLLLITMGSSNWEGTEVFHGIEMFWSHFDAQTNRALVEDAGLRVELDEIDASGGEQHQVLLGLAL